MSTEIVESTEIDNDEKIINWEEEATAIINDVKMHVAHIEISQILPSSESNIYMNIRTIEGQDFCVHVSAMGFRVVSNAYDTIDSERIVIKKQQAQSTTKLEDQKQEGEDVEEEEEIFETPYALLDKISPRYVESFGNQLCKQLLHLQQMRTQFNEEDEEGFEEDEDEDVKNEVDEHDDNKQALKPKIQMSDTHVQESTQS